MMPIKNQEIEQLSHRLREKIYHSRTGLDFIPQFEGRLLEIRSGIIKSWPQLLETTEKIFTETQKICKEKKWVFFSAGSLPVFGCAVGLHVHIGSCYTVKAANPLADSLIPYAPCFAALMANSPVWNNLENGEYKSYRVLKYADWCSVVRTITDTDYMQMRWGQDVQVKVGTKPTIEFRIADCPSSPQLVSEYTAFVAAFTASVANKTEHVTKQRYLEYIENRWRAARYGLQAMFSWKGKPRPVNEILSEMLDTAKPGFKSIGCRLSDFKIIPKMLELCQTQADWQALIYEKNKDAHRFTKEISRYLQEKNLFEDYLNLALPLKPVKSVDMEKYVLSKIGKDTPYLYLYGLLQLPFGILEKKLKTLERKGKVKVTKIPEEGPQYTRI